MRITYILIALIALFYYPLHSQGSQSEEIKIELSNPGSPGFLDASSHRGGMKVEAHNGNNVIVTLIADKDNKDQKTKNGLKMISGGSATAEIVEENNVVYIETGSQNKVDLLIKVPQNFSVKLHTHHDGDIFVKGIDGTSEIDAHHGGVKLENVGSSANVNTHHGEIEATFRGVDPGMPMVLTTYHGDVDITLPSNANFKTKLKTTKGDIYTDFELKMEVSANKVENNGKGSKIEIGGWRHGSVGTAGPEYMLSSYHGDIIIRKQ